MAYTTNLIKERWYEPLYNEVLKVCDYMLNYTEQQPDSQIFLRGEDLLIGNNTTVFVGIRRKDSKILYSHIGVYSTYPNMLRYFILQKIEDGRVEYTIDRNEIIDNGILYGQYWYDGWKASKSPMWIDMHTLRKYIEKVLTEQYGIEYIYNMNLEDYIKLETNQLILVPKEKKYVATYDEMVMMFNIRNTIYEKYHPTSFPITDL